MTTWQAMNQLERLGYQFEATAEGVHVTLQGAPLPEASALLEIARRDREAARAYVMERQAGAHVAEDGSTYSVLDALAIAQAVRKGEARLLGKVIFHRPAGVVTVRWEPLNGESEDNCLSRHRDALQNALEGCLKALEERDYTNLTAEEKEAYCRQYERYLAVLEMRGEPNE
jgi:hypothetical protein